MTVPLYPYLLPRQTNYGKSHGRHHGLTIQPLLMNTVKSVLKTLSIAEMLSSKFLSNLPSAVKEVAHRFVDQAAMT